MIFLPQSWGYRTILSKQKKSPLLSVLMSSIQLSLLCQSEEMHHFSPSISALSPHLLRLPFPLENFKLQYFPFWRRLWWTCTGPAHQAPWQEGRWNNPTLGCPGRRGQPSPAAAHTPDAQRLWSSREKPLYLDVHSLDECAEPAVLILDRSRDGTEYFSSVFKSDIPGKETLPISWSFIYRGL